jgi:hypothetical protein
VALGHGHEVHDDLAAQAPESELARERAGGGEVGLERRGGRGVSAGVHVHGHEGARGLEDDVGVAQVGLGGAERVDLVEHAFLREAAGLRHDGRRGPFAPGEEVGAVALDQELGLAGGVGHDLVAEVAHGGDVLGHFVVGRSFGGRTQDQAEVQALHAVLGQRHEAGALLVVLDLARDVESRRLGRDDGEAGLEEEAVGDGDGLAAFGGAGDLHQHGLAGPEARGVAEPGGAAFGQAQDHAALPLQAAVRDGAEDGAGARGGVVVQEEVVEAAVHEERRGLAAPQVVEDDAAALHSDLSGRPRSG